MLDMSPNMAILPHPFVGQFPVPVMPQCGAMVYATPAAINPLYDLAQYVNIHGQEQQHPPQHQQQLHNQQSRHNSDQLHHRHQQHQHHQNNVHPILSQLTWCGDSRPFVTMPQIRHHFISENIFAFKHQEHIQKQLKVHEQHQHHEHHEKSQRGEIHEKESDTKSAKSPPLEISNQERVELKYPSKIRKQHLNIDTNHNQTHLPDQQLNDAMCFKPITKSHDSDTKNFYKRTQSSSTKSHSQYNSQSQSQALPMPLSHSPTPCCTPQNRNESSPLKKYDLPNHFRETSLEKDAVQFFSTDAINIKQEMKQCSTFNVTVSTSIESTFLQTNCTSPGPTIHHSDLEGERSGCKSLTCDEDSSESTKYSCVKNLPFRKRNFELVHQRDETLKTQSVSSCGKYFIPHKMSFKLSI